jgi:hypothetical protein
MGSELLSSEEEAIAAAEKIGYPVSRGMIGELPLLHHDEMLILPRAFVADHAQSHGRRWRDGSTNLSFAQ